MRKDDAPCEYCGKTMNHRCDERWNHLMQCEKAQQSMQEGIDYVVCPICGIWKEDLGVHLFRVHQIPKDKKDELFPDLQSRCSKYIEKKNQICLERYGSSSPFGDKDVRQKAKDTTREHYGVDNPFASPEVQDKIKVTNNERYGCDHPMQNEDVFIKQQKSANQSPNNLEQFFDEHTGENVVFTGYGGRYVRTKTGVHKYGRLIKDLCPDFMILPDHVLESARRCSQEKTKMNRERHRTRYVIELLGDYYHSEEVIGVPSDEHEAELIAAYASANIQCLTIWETDIVHKWNETRGKIDDWTSKAVSDMNERPIYKKSTRAKVDRRKASIVCPLGSGERFKTQEQLKEWLKSDSNLYRLELIEGCDYVVCGECGKRFRKLGIHLARTHKMSEAEYLVLHPGGQIVADAEVVKITDRLKSKKRGSYKKKVAYRLPDGSYVRRKPAWKKAWGVDDPPIDSIVDASEVDFDPWVNQQEGIDYVVCVECGFKGKNITRHVNREHVLSEYTGDLKSLKCKDSLSLAANKS